MTRTVIIQEKRRRKTLAWVAGATAAALLLGSSSFAVWSGQSQGAVPQIAVGQLTMDETMVDGWFHDTIGGEPVTKVVPGDVVVAKATTVAHGVGENLRARLSIVSPMVNGTLHNISFATTCDGEPCNAGDVFDMAGRDMTIETLITASMDINDSGLGMNRVQEATEITHRLTQVPIPKVGGQARMEITVDTEADYCVTPGLYVGTQEEGVTIEWGDGTTSDVPVVEPRSVTLLNHDYAEPGRHQLALVGNIQKLGPELWDGWDTQECIISVDRWDDNGVEDLHYAFGSAENIESVVAPPTSVTDMSYMFAWAWQWSPNLSGWDVSNVENMAGMFYANQAFDSDLSGWDVSNVTDMSEMFVSATVFDSDLSGWDVSNVTDMREMFTNATFFNGDISTWNTSKVEDMSVMFDNAAAFNQDISTKTVTVDGRTYTAWDTSNVSNMGRMFLTARAFDQDLSNWNVTRIPAKPQYFDQDSGFAGQTAKQPRWGTDGTQR